MAVEASSSKSENGPHCKEVRSGQISALRSKSVRHTCARTPTRHLLSYIIYFWVFNGSLLQSMEGVEDDQSMMQSSRCDVDYHILVIKRSSGCIIYTNRLFTWHFFHNFKHLQLDVSLLNQLSKVPDFLNQNVCKQQPRIRLQPRRIPLPSPSLRTPHHKRRKSILHPLYPSIFIQN